MKKIVLILAIVLLALNFSFSQPPEKIEEANSSTITRNIIGFVPSKADNINGWAIGWEMISGHDKDLLINGAYTNLSPFQIYWGAVLTVFSIAAIFGSKEGFNFETSDSTIYGIYSEKSWINFNKTLNGISVSVVDDAGRAKINGLEISLITQHTGCSNGVSLSGIFNSKTQFNGLMTGIMNLSEQGNGVQIGLVNNCGSLNGVQIGLINRSEKRLLPLVNIGTKKSHKN